MEEIQRLKERIKFLESIIDINSETLRKAIETNRMLVEIIKKES